MQEFRSQGGEHPGQSRRRTLLSIAGFDPSSGAGLTADLKVFSAHGAYGLSCPTGWTVQSTRGVQGVFQVTGAQVSETLACLAEDFELDGVKIGMLGTAEVLGGVAAWLSQARARQPALPVVLDPVLRSSSGRELLELAALPRLAEWLLPLVTVITPNLGEAALLAGLPGIADRASVEQAAQRLLAAMGGKEQAVIVTGGHLTGAGPDDYVCTSSGGVWLAGAWVQTTSTHGTGCAYSSALLCALAAGEGLTEAARSAKAYVAEAMRRAYPVGGGRGPLHHLYRCDP